MLFRVFTVVAVIALAISTWILSSPSRHMRMQANAQKADFPGYYLRNAVLTDYAASGDLSIRIEADRIDQIAHGSEVSLHNVTVDYRAPNGQTWVMIGDTAQVLADGEVVEVAGNVRLQGAAETEGRSGEAVIHTDALRYNVTDAIASTSSDVRIDFARHTLNAHGLTASLKERTLRLESKVSGKFSP